MKWIKGIALFLVANFLIYLTLTFTANLLINVVLPAFGIDVRGAFNEQLLVWSLVIGFGGAFISLLFSKQMARAMLSNAQQITSPRSHAEQMIYGSVQDIARRLSITMPEVWVYEAEDPNAFATGPSKNNSMVAVSTGLLQNLKEDEVRAVLAHEMGHVYNGDMFTTTVLAGLMNTFVYYISNFLSSLVGQSGDREEGAAGNPFLGFIVYIVLQVVLSFMAMLVVSRQGRHDLGPAGHQPLGEPRPGGIRHAGSAGDVQDFRKNLRSHASVRHASADGRADRGLGTALKRTAGRLS
jgi:heat shock protein HtpX